MMKKNLIFILLPLAVLAILLWTGAFYTLIPESKAVPAKNKFVNATEANKADITDEATAGLTAAQPTEPEQELTNYALSLLGSPYVYAGMSPEGFDCSGFITYVYNQFDIALPHSSAMQANEGYYISKDAAKAGDLVIFTGTNPDVREPGHVGIVLSSPGDTISFVHSSSNGGVKISKVQGTGYDIRFLEIRRVL
ncbi:C40 family peptidase [Pontibacter sp. H249]|uniref:C40 family peptidase n=1 Tax=Pontibacter sp. H249 TaxID=3133420 RepID=UPI0030C548B6